MMPFVDSKPRYETITYSPGLIDSADLEAATSAIADAAKPAAAQYSKVMTLPAPTDSRLAVTRIGTRLSITPDSFNGGCAHLYVQVYVDDPTGLVANNQLMSVDIAAAANSLTVQDCLVGTKEVIFNLLKDGAAHTFYFFLWVDAGNAVVSVVQAWEAVGTTSADNAINCVAFNHRGEVTSVLVGRRIGGTNVTTRLFAEASSNFQGLLVGGAGAATSSICYVYVMVFDYLLFCTYAGATDIGYVYTIQITARSE